MKHNFARSWTIGDISTDEKEEKQLRRQVFALQTCFGGVSDGTDGSKYFIFRNVDFSRDSERLGSRETKGIMVAVGWEWQEQGGYEVVGHLPDYRMACFRKFSDEI